MLNRLTTADLGPNGQGQGQCRAHFDDEHIVNGDRFGKRYYCQNIAPNISYQMCCLHSLTFELI